MPFADLADEVRRLATALARVGDEAPRLGIPGPAAREWWELLCHKLLPQVNTQPVLVAAVVGGTNLGKSLIFNHLAGETASAVSPLAAGTRHPVCLVPEDFDAASLLPSLFEGFTLVPWQDSQQALGTEDEHLMLWRTSKSLPSRLLLLDTPDIDSDARVNWERADAVRRVADVLIAVLTQQKYNDAAVKQFFRKAAAAEKPAIVVFNQVDLQEDRDYWPLWLDTFTGNTGVKPEQVYLVPYDRTAANNRTLPFFAAGTTGRAEPVPGSLREDLAQLHFDRIKTMTLRGALRVVQDDATGAAAFLREVRAASAEFSAAVDVMSAEDLARVPWPPLPTRVLVDEIRAWWDTSRPAWSRQIHQFYRAIGTGVTWPVKEAYRRISGAPEDPLVPFRRRESEAVVQALSRLFDELTRLARIGNPRLQPRLDALLRGESRQQLIERARQCHAELMPVSTDYRAFLAQELERWGNANPKVVSWLRSIDHASAIARPAITVTLAISGWFLAGGFVHEAAVHAASHSAAQLATEAAITGGIAGGGEAILSSTGESLQLAAARLFNRLQEQYAASRANWLAQWLEHEMLGQLLGELRAAAEVPALEPFRNAEAALAHLQRRLFSADDAAM